MKNKTKKYILFFYFLVAGAAIANDEYYITYDFSAVFLAKTCDIDAPESVWFNNTSHTSTVSDIQNNKVETEFTVKLKNCTSNDQDNAKVYLSTGTTITGTNNYFNNDPNGVIGVQILDGNRVIYRQPDNEDQPVIEAVVWDNIKNNAESKTLKAKLKCVVDGCKPEDGDFSATLTLGYYVE